MVKFVSLGLFHCVFPEGKQRVKLLLFCLFPSFKERVLLPVEAAVRAGNSVHFVAIAVPYSIWECKDSRLFWLIKFRTGKSKNFTGCFSGLAASGLSGLQRYGGAFGLCKRFRK